MANNVKESVQGILFVHAETGTEGGSWAFQDSRFISENTTRFSCTRCGLPWDKSIETKEQVLQKAERFQIAKQLSCKHDFQLVSPENWSYDGLCVLESGDHLKVFSKDDASHVIWEGVLSLKDQDTAQYNDTGKFLGYGMHSEPAHVDPLQWKDWFNNGYKAELTRK